MLLHELLARLPHHKRNAPGDFHASCPAHDDSVRDPGKFSLHVTETTDRILLRCFAGCRTEDVLAALQLKSSDLFITNGANGHRSKKNPGRIVAAYAYVSPLGDTVYETVRYEPKDFRARRPDGTGGWIWNLDGVRRILYRLPDLFEQPRVILTEGEKDADRLCGLGLIATTTVGGSDAWRDVYAQQLAQAGAQLVVIIPDNDPAGEKYAMVAARACQALGIAAKIVRLPGLAAKGDVSDYLDAGHTVEELEALIDATAVLEAVASDGPESRDTELADDHADEPGPARHSPHADDDPVEAILAEAQDDEDTDDLPEPVAIGQLVRRTLATLESGEKPDVIPTPFSGLNDLLDGGFYRRELALIGGKTTTGKSGLVKQVAVSAGRHGYRVLMMSLEMSKETVSMRMLAQQTRVFASALRRNAVSVEDLALLRKKAAEFDGLPIDVTDQYTGIRSIVRKVARLAKTATPVDLLICDYLQLIRAPRKIRDRRQQVEYVNQTLRRLAIRFNLAVICISSLRRLGKDETPGLDALRESGDLEYSGDVVIILTREFDKRETQCRVCKQRNGKTGEVELLFEWEYVRFAEG